MSVPEIGKTSARVEDEAPAGGVEMTSASTRFSSFQNWGRNWGKFASVIGISLAVGFAIGMQRGRQKLEKAPKTGPSDS